MSNVSVMGQTGFALWIILLGVHRAGCAACTAVPMPLLWRSHDRLRGVRARPRAEVAADAGQDRHIVSQRLSASAAFLFQTRWRHAGGDLSRPNHIISARIARSCDPNTRQN